MNFFIKKATEVDIKSIQKIAAETWAITYQHLPNGQLDYMLKWMYSDESLKNQMNQGHQFFIADLNGEIIGFSSVSKEEDSIFKLNKLYVLPNSQKCGAGRKLLETVLIYAEVNKATEIQLQVNRFNNACEFYKKFGFEILFEADFEIGNGFFMNDYVMSLKL